MSQGLDLLERIWEVLLDITDRAGRMGVIGSVEHLLHLDEHAVDLAYTVLLVNVALIDNDFAPREGYFIKQELQKHLGIDYEQSRKLLDEARKVVEGDQKLDQFGSYLRGRLSIDRRRELYDVISRLVTEDRETHAFEIELQDRYRKILGV